METVCIRCPIGCHLIIQKNNGEVVVSGNRCPRGEEYGKQECTNPLRTITTVYNLAKGGTLCLRTSKPVPKEKYFLVLKAIKSASEPKSIKVGGIFLENVCNTGSNIIVTEVNKI